MDKRDLEIMKVLDHNARQSNSQIAKKVGLSKDVVNYRIKKLKNQQIITGYYAVVNGARLGNKYYKLLLRFQTIGKEREQELIMWLKERTLVNWVGSCDGSWSIIITLSVKDLKELDEFLEEAYLKFGEGFQKKEILITKQIQVFNEKYLYTPERLNYVYKIDTTDEAVNIDDTDKIILQELAKNARVPVTNISERTTLTAEAVAQRIRKLIDNKLIIGFKPRIDFVKLGYQYHHVFISVKGAKKTKEIINYYQQHNSCITIIEYVGYYDLHLELVLKSNQEFREAILDLRNKFGNSIIEYEPLTIYTEYLLIPIPTTK